MQQHIFLIMLMFAFNLYALPILEMSKEVEELRVNTKSFSIPSMKKQAWLNVLYNEKMYWQLSNRVFFLPGVVFKNGKINDVRYIRISLQDVKIESVNFINDSLEKCPKGYMVPFSVKLRFNLSVTQLFRYGKASEGSPVLRLQDVVFSMNKSSSGIYPRVKFELNNQNRFKSFNVIVTDDMWDLESSDLEEWKLYELLVREAVVDIGKFSLRMAKYLGLKVVGDFPGKKLFQILDLNKTLPENRAKRGFHKYLSEYMNLMVNKFFLYHINKAIKVRWPV